MTAYTEEFNNEFSKTIFYPIKELYIDLQCLQDIHLGALLLNCFNEENYNYLISKLKDYNNRITRNHTSYFPKLNMHNDELEKIIIDPEYLDRLLVVSPHTTLYLNMARMIKDVYEHNSKFDFDKGITYSINVYPLQLEHKHKIHLKEKIKKFDPFANVGIISKPANQLHISTYQKFNFMFIYDIISFLEESSPVHDMFYKQFAFSKIGIYTPKRVDDKFDFTNVDMKDMFTKTAAILNIYCDFKYLDIGIVVSDGKQ